jgi:hypothetical protein
MTDEHHLQRFVVVNQAGRIGAQGWGVEREGIALTLIVRRFGVPFHETVFPGTSLESHNAACLRPNRDVFHNLDRA